MKLVHIADLHLGYRAYHRSDAMGINIREADVARAFRETLSRAAEIGPDLLLIAGDVFHTVRPSNAAIADAFRQFACFRAGAEGTRVVIIAGNHDSPRAAETGNILRLFEEIPGVHVVHQSARRLAFPELRAAVLCLPHNELIGESQPAIEPEPGVAFNILLAHAALESAKIKLILDLGVRRLRSDAIDPDEWSYVALGHYHVPRYTEIAPNMCYSGGIERTSLNIWAEADQPKGFVEFDLETGHRTFHELESPRTVIDLPPVQGHGLSATELDSAIESSLASVHEGIEGKIIRLRIFDVPRDVYRNLDHRKIREYRYSALHFKLDARPPAVSRHEGAGAPGHRLSLQEEMVSFLKSRWNPAAGEATRKAVIELAVRYLKEAEEAEALKN